MTAPYAARAADAEMLGGHGESEFAHADDLSNPSSINDVGNPVDWTKLTSVPVGFADGIDHTGGGGDGHSLDAADGSPLDVVYVDTEGEVGIGTTSPEVLLHVDGEIQSGSAGEVGGLADWDSSAWQPVAYVAPVFNEGGGVSLLDENGTLHGGMGPSLNTGGGGALVVMRDDAGNAGFVVDGNYLDTQEPLVQISGSSNSATFNMDASGDGTVALPSNAINSFELLEEPGVASTQDLNWVYLTGAPTLDALGSCYIYAPDHGYVLAIGTAQAQVDHSGAGTAYFGVSELASSFSDHAQSTLLSLPGSAPAGYYDMSLAVHGLFAVAPGGHWFYFLGRENAGEWYIESRQFTLVFLPTAYGTVDTDDALAGPDRGGEGSALGAAENLGGVSTERAAAGAGAHGGSYGELLEDLIARLETLERRAAERD